MSIEINEALARKVLRVVDAGLVAGLGQPIPGHMCVEAAVTFAMGEQFSDEPSCVAPVLRGLKIRLNDAPWSSNEARTQGLRRLALCQLGSAGVLNEREFADRLVKLAIGLAVPQALRAAASICKDDTRKRKLFKAAQDCESDPTPANAAYAANAANAAYAANAAAANAAYAAYAAYAAADAADYAANAAADAADYAAYAADAANAADAARSKAEAFSRQLWDESLAFLTRLILVTEGDPENVQRD
jgi:hypothetical protein